MKFRFAVAAVAVSMCVGVPAFAQTATQNTEKNAAGAGGSTGSIGSNTVDQHAANENAAKAKRTAVDNHSSAHAAAGAGDE